MAEGSLPTSRGRLAVGKRRFRMNGRHCDRRNIATQVAKIRIPTTGNVWTGV
jgi:hypothetical protein